MKEKFLGRYFLSFWALIVLMSALLFFHVLDQSVFGSIINTAILGFFGGGALTALMGLFQKNKPEIPQ